MHTNKSRPEEPQEIEELVQAAKAVIPTLRAWVNWATTDWRVRERALNDLMNAIERVEGQ